MTKTFLVGQLSALILYAFSSVLQVQADCDGIISGTVHYTGSQTGPIHIIAFDPDSDPNIVAEVELPTPGPYSLTVPEGVYYVVAQMDADHSGGFSLASFQQDEPSGNYGIACGPDVAIAVNCDLHENIDIYLSDFIQAAALQDSFSADYFSGAAGDMSYHDGLLWISDFTGPASSHTMDIHKVNPGNGAVIDSYDLGVDFITSLEWIGDDLWVSFTDIYASGWFVRQYTFDGLSFTPGLTFTLPSSGDRNIIWSINIAWDGNLLWVQEKGECVNIYKIALPGGTIVETIPDDQFSKKIKVGLADISDIFFSDGFLWAMDDDYPNLVRIELTGSAASRDMNFTFDPAVYTFVDAKYNGMVKHGDILYFIQHPDVALPSFNILTASIDMCALNQLPADVLATSYGRSDCDQPGGCKGNFDYDADVDGLDLAEMVACN